MISIDLDAEIVQRLRALAKRTGQTEGELARELANPGRAFTSAEIRRELGLDD
jgi:predicted transcriptional regulator